VATSAASNQCESAGIRKRSRPAGMTLVPSRRGGGRLHHQHPARSPAGRNHTSPAAHPPGDPEKPGGGRPRHRLLCPEGSGRRSPGSQVSGFITRKRRKGTDSRYPLEMTAGAPRILVGDIRKEKRDLPSGGDRLPEHTRAFLKDPGRLRRLLQLLHRPPRAGPQAGASPRRRSCERIASISRAGLPRVVLTGSTLGAWGRDLKPQEDLVTLVRANREGSAMERLRLSSIEPRELTMNSSPPSSGLKERSAPPPHPPSERRQRDPRAMRPEIDRCCLFPGPQFGSSRGCPRASLVGIDVMAGFPDETEEAFANTLHMVEEIPIAYLMSSPTPGGRARPPRRWPGRSPRRKKETGETSAVAGAAKRQAFAAGSSVRRPGPRRGRTDKNTGFLRRILRQLYPVAVRGGVPQTGSSGSCRKPSGRMSDHAEVNPPNDGIMGFADFLQVHQTMDLGMLD